MLTKKKFCLFLSFTLFITQTSSCYGMRSSLQNLTDGKEEKPGSVKLKFPLKATDEAEKDNLAHSNLTDRTDEDTQESKQVRLVYVDKVPIFTPEEAKKLPSQHPNLTHIDLRNNNVQDEGVEALSGMRHLTELMLSNNGLTNQSVKSVAKIGTLVTLDLSHNKIGDRGVADLKALRRLVNLNLGFNEITLEGTQAIATHLRQLKILDLSGNNINVSQGRGGVFHLRSPLLKWGFRIGSYLVFDQSLKRLLVSFVLPKVFFTPQKEQGEEANQHNSGKSEENKDDKFMSAAKGILETLEQAKLSITSKVKALFINCEGNLRASGSRLTCDDHLKIGESLRFVNGARLECESDVIYDSSSLTCNDAFKLVAPKANYLARNFLSLHCDDHLSANNHEITCPTNLVIGTDFIVQRDARLSCHDKIVLNENGIICPNQFELTGHGLTTFTSQILAEPFKEEVKLAPPSIEFSAAFTGFKKEETIEAKINPKSSEYLDYFLANMNLISTSVFTIGQHFWDRYWQDQGAQALANLPHLKELKIVGTDTGNTGAKALAKSESLESLYLMKNPAVTEVGLWHLKSNPSLKKLFVTSEEKDEKQSKRSVLNRLSSLAVDKQIVTQLAMMCFVEFFISALDVLGGHNVNHSLTSYVPIIILTYLLNLFF